MLRPRHPEVRRDPRLAETDVQRIQEPPASFRCFVPWNVVGGVVVRYTLDGHWADLAVYLVGVEVGGRRDSLKQSIVFFVDINISLVSLFWSCGFT